MISLPLYKLAQIEIFTCTAHLLIIRDVWVREQERLLLADKEKVDMTPHITLECSMVSQLKYSFRLKVGGILPPQGMGIEIPQGQAQLDQLKLQSQVLHH